MDEIMEMSEPASQMQVYQFYVVARASEGGEFKIGDKICLLSSGDILLPSFGIMDAVDVPSATRGMRVCRLSQEGEE